MAGLQGTDIPLSKLPATVAQVALQLRQRFPAFLFSKQDKLEDERREPVVVRPFVATNLEGGVDVMPQLIVAQRLPQLNMHARKEFVEGIPKVRAASAGFQQSDVRIEQLDPSDPEDDCSPPHLRRLAASGIGSSAHSLGCFSIKQEGASAGAEA